MKTSCKQPKPLRYLILSLILLTVLQAAGCQVKPEKVDPGHATYQGLKGNEFMKNWLVLGPVPFGFPGENSDSIYKIAFESNQPVILDHVSKSDLSELTVNDQPYKWLAVSCKRNGIDLTESLGQSFFAYAYAQAEIVSDQSGELLMGIGSDDGVRVFLNGVEIHSNSMTRPVTEDEDLFIINLKKGSNKLLLKILNGYGGWGFSIRPLTGQAVLNRFIEACAEGMVEDIKLLENCGADSNETSSTGLNAWWTARINGREEILKYLEGIGAGQSANMPQLSVLADSLFKKAGNDGSPGVAVLIARKGNILYKQGYGYANIEKKEAVTPETKFRIGSISKQFTAAAILRLRDQGKLDLSDSLSRYIPDFPQGNKVNLIHLLTHTSGIKSYTNEANFIDRVTNGISSEKLLEEIKSLGYEFEPGEKYKYNNSGFFILGYLVEQISGKKLGDYLKDEFFLPLEMENTGVHFKDIDLDNEATGYTFNEGKAEPSLDWNMSWAGGAGALYSTVEDLYKWNEALFNYKVLSEESLKKAKTPVVLNNKTDTIDYGFGLAMNTFRGMDFISHGGGLHGFLSFLARQVDEQFTVVVLINSTPPFEGIEPYSYAQTLAQNVLWQKMDKQESYTKVVELTSAMLKILTGKYDYGNGAVLTVREYNGKLYAQLTGQPEFEIFPKSENMFYWKVVEAGIEFIKNDNGDIEYAIHRQGGMTLKVPKLQD